MFPKCGKDVQVALHRACLGWSQPGTELGGTDMALELCSSCSSPAWPRLAHVRRHFLPVLVPSPHEKCVCVTRSPRRRGSLGHPCVQVHKVGDCGWI